MAVIWTSQQKEVIESENCNLLVSAAAGSGKTAALVERIIDRLTREDHPADISRLLVVTFTKAAAAEMRERT
jgi:ATP-dependent helicase/nuclease subunit A